MIRNWAYSGELDIDDPYAERDGESLMAAPDPIGSDMRRAALAPKSAARRGVRRLWRNRSRVLQAHHIAGATNDPGLTVVLC